MHKVIETIDVLGGDMIEKRLDLLIREGVRRHRDTTLRTRFLSFLDLVLGLGYWWYPTFEYEARTPDGSLYKRYQVRRMLAGYTICWGYHSVYYDNGAKSNEGEIWTTIFTNTATRRNHKYWLPDGTNVSHTEWMREMFGPEVDDFRDFASEHGFATIAAASSPLFD